MPAVPVVSSIARLETPEPTIRLTKTAAEILTKAHRNQFQTRPNPNQL